MDLFAAILTAGVALVLLLAGFRLARIVIPLWGFVIGLSVGGAVASDLSDAPFLAATLGILVGLFMGLMFALLAYLYYAVAVLLLAGGVGYWLGSGFIVLLGFSPGAISVFLGIVLGLLFGLVALLTNAPKYVLIFLTSVGGAVALIGAFLILFNQIPADAFSYAAARAEVAASWWWSLVAIALAIGGVIFQSASTSNYDFEKWYIGKEDLTPPTSSITERS